MNIAIRIDSGRATGIGHLKRCLALADAPELSSARIAFVVGDDPAAARAIIPAKWDVSPVQGQNSLSGLPEMIRAVTGNGSVGVAVVDWRGANRAFLESLRERGVPVALIEDLGDAPCAVDLIVNSNAYADEIRYPEAQHATVLRGLDYVLMRSEFSQVQPRVVAERVRELVVTLGGGDVRKLTVPVLGMLAGLRKGWNVTVVIGPMIRDRESVITAAREMYPGARLLVDPKRLVSVMENADLAIAAGGQTLYELLRTGCPTIAIETTPDQRDQIRAVADAGAVFPVGTCANDLTRVAQATLALCDDVESRARLAAAGQALIDGKGASRVARAIVSLAERSSCRKE